MFAMLGDVFVVGLLGSALGMVSSFTGIARPCAGPKGSSVTNPWAVFYSRARPNTGGSLLNKSIHHGNLQQKELGTGHTKFGNDYINSYEHDIRSLSIDCISIHFRLKWNMIHGE